MAATNKLKTHCTSTFPGQFHKARLQAKLEQFESVLQAFSKIKRSMPTSSKDGKHSQNGNGRRLFPVSERKTLQQP